MIMIRQRTLNLLRRLLGIPSIRLRGISSDALSSWVWLEGLVCWRGAGWQDLDVELWLGVRGGVELVVDGWLGGG